MPNHSSNQPNFKRILIVTQRYLGDTLLTTALIHSLRVAYPKAVINVLLPKANSGIMQGNPDLNELVFFPEKSGAFVFLTFLTSIYQQYDLAISLQNSDRTSLCAILAAKCSMGFIDVHLRKSWWKKIFFSHYLLPSSEHTALENLRFCKPLNIPAITKLITPSTCNTQLSFDISMAYAVLHITPQWRFKEWHQNGWLEVIEHLHQHQLQIVLTGSPNQQELINIQNLISQSQVPIINLAGCLSFPELSALIKQAVVFIGPDTGITHLAAATGTPCIALFGPTNPEKWGPWPSEYQSLINPYQKRGTQIISNVFLLQDPSPRACIPCQNEGCEKNRQSKSDCLDSLPASLVIESIEQAILISKTHII